MSRNPTALSNSDLAVLDALHSAPESVSQRDIARRTGLSVGLINAVIKKLVLTGYVKTSHLDRRSIKYLLTSEGFAETAIKSYKYVLKTVRSYRVIKQRLHALLENLKNEGISDFYLNGDGELAELVAAFFAEENKGRLCRNLPDNGCSEQKSVVLNAVPEKISDSAYRVVDLIHELNNVESGAI